MNCWYNPSIGSLNYSSTFGGDFEVVVLRDRSKGTITECDDELPWVYL